MIDEEHVKWIIEDIKKDIPVIEKMEEYEALVHLTAIIKDLNGYVSGALGYDDIAESLMAVCMSRYSIFRLLMIEGTRFVVFNINYPALITIYVDSEKEETPVWKQLQEDLVMQDKELADLIIKNWFIEDESDGPGEDII